MKTSGHLIFYISENEDFELWRVLTQISPEDRAAFIKNALKKALIHEEAKQPTFKSPVVRNNVGDTSISELALEELGYSAIASAMERDLDPVNYFSNQRTSMPEDNQSKSDIFSDDEEISILQLDELLKPMDVEVRTPMKGLDFLLTNVIGEESDEDVIDFFRRRREDSDEEI